jgi:hypothetical protein
VTRATLISALNCTMLAFGIFVKGDISATVVQQMSAKHVGVNPPPDNNHMDTLALAWQTTELSDSDLADSV